MMPPKLFDTHCHLDADGLYPDRAHHVAKAVEAGVTTIVNPGAYLQTMDRLQVLAEEFEQVWISPGAHPLYLDGLKVSHLDRLDQFIVANRKKVVAVGEIGLDRYEKDVDMDKQKLFFQRQLEIAIAHELPVIIHCRKMYNEVFQMLKDFPFGVLFHAYGSSIEMARSNLHPGWMFALGATVTFPTAKVAPMVAGELDLDRLVIETDAPCLTIYPVSDGIVGPSQLEKVAQAMAAKRGQTYEEIAEATTHNAKKFFGLEG